MFSPRISHTCILLLVKNREFPFSRRSALSSLTRRKRSPQLRVKEPHEMVDCPMLPSSARLPSPRNRRFPSNPFSRAPTSPHTQNPRRLLTLTTSNLRTKRLLHPSSSSTHLDLSSFLRTRNRTTSSRTDPIREHLLSNVFSQLLLYRTTNCLPQQPLTATHSSQWSFCTTRSDLSGSEY